MSFSKKPMAKRRSRVAMASTSRTSQLSRTENLKTGKASVSDLSKSTPNKYKTPVKKPIKKLTPVQVPVASEMPNNDNALEDDRENGQSQQVIESSSSKEYLDQHEEPMTTQEREHNMTYNLLVKSLFAIEEGELLEPPNQMSMNKLDETIENTIADMQEIDRMYQETAKKCVRLLRMWEVKHDMLTLLSGNKAEREDLEQAKMPPEETF